MNKVPVSRIGKGDIKGPCCGCLIAYDCQNLVMISRKAPVAGLGWGCNLCLLRRDGAMAILCDRCVSLRIAPICAVGFDPGSDVRVGLATLVGAHRHREGCSVAGTVWEIGDGFAAGDLVV